MHIALYENKYYAMNTILRGKRIMATSKNNKKKIKNINGELNLYNKTSDHTMSRDHHFCCCSSS